jgi:hypothetical protein
VSTNARNETAFAGKATWTTDSCFTGIFGILFPGNRKSLRPSAPIIAYFTASDEGRGGLSPPEAKKNEKMILSEE